MALDTAQTPKIGNNHLAHQRTILIIDDEDQIREAIGIVLGFSGYKIVQANNGSNALQSLGKFVERSMLPDLIICDVSMPVMDGFSFLRAIREDSRFRTIPFFFLSAKRDFKPEEIALVQTTKGFIQKPVTPPDLIQKIRNVLAD